MLERKPTAVHRDMLCLPWRNGTPYESLPDLEIAVTPWRSETLPGSARVYTHGSSAGVTWARVDDHRIVGTGDASPPLPPGVYEVCVSTCDRRGVRAQQTIRFRVETEALTMIQEYVVKDASTETAWDGEVVATVLHAPTRVKYAWSNGAVTTEPILKDLPPGQYSCTPIDCHEETLLPHMHLATSAIVNVAE
jgi:hypothetical protein